jgi:hypothetical protein
MAPTSLDEEILLRSAGSLRRRTWPVQVHVLWIVKALLHVARNCHERVSEQNDACFVEGGLFDGWSSPTLYFYVP